MASDYLEWGADWLLDMTQEHASQSVELSWVDGTPATKIVQASLVDEEGRILRADVKVRTENTFFLFSTNDLVDVPVKRGLRITWNSTLFEVVISGGRCYFFNDTHQRQTVVVTKHVSD